MGRPNLKAAFQYTAAAVAVATGECAPVAFEMAGAAYTKTAARLGELKNKK